MARRILVLNGSTRTRSTNGLFIHAIERLAGTRAVFVHDVSIVALPHFDPDADTGTPPPEVARFRQLLGGCDGLLLCTPEYAMGVPGSLKNALDWTVSSADLRHKPVLLVVASLSGEKALVSLQATLLVLEAVLTPATTVLIPFARTKVDATGTITDADTAAEVSRAVDAFLG